MGLVYANKEGHDAPVRQIIEPTDNANALCTFCSFVVASEDVLDALRRIGEREKELPAASCTAKKTLGWFHCGANVETRASTRGLLRTLPAVTVRRTNPSTTPEIDVDALRRTTRANGDHPGSTDGVATLVDDHPKFSSASTRARAA